MTVDLEAGLRQYWPIPSGFAPSPWTATREFRYLNDWLDRNDLDYPRYLGEPRWLELKRRHSAKYGRGCWICGASNDSRLHHLTYRRLGKEELDDLIWLCRKHHAEVHNLDRKSETGAGAGRWRPADSRRRQLAWYVAYVRYEYEQHLEQMPRPPGFEVPD